MSKLAKALTAAAGNAGESLYVEDVFSTYLYTGNGTSQTITNGIDLDGEGGLVWLQGRTSATGSRLDDTERPLNDHLRTFSTEAPLTYSVFSSLNSNGFSLVDSNMNSSGADYVSWTFRKAEKFFDVVTYTGNGTTQEISHNLGSTPACIIVKNTQSSTFWAVYHGSIPAFVGFLNATNAFDTSNTQNFGNNTSPVAPTDSVFTVGQQSLVNSGGETYVAYLFASDAGGFGDDGSENIIKCGSYTTDGSEEATIDLGFEPQWVLFKRTDSATGGDWNLFDTMRGITADTSTAGAYVLETNTSDAEDLTSRIAVTSTGFKVDNYGASRDYIYIAIRRPMKTPESGTEVFAATVDTTATTLKSIDVGFPTDFALQAITEGGPTFASSRLTGNSWLVTDTTAAESAGDGTFYIKFDQQDDFSTRLSDQDNVFYNFKRATGFFDVVAYTGTGVARTVNHNLGVVPELMIVKRRNGTGQWSVYHSELGGGYYLRIAPYGTDAAASNTQFWNNTDPTSSVFSVGSSSDTNGSSNTYITYLFATLAGVSKVGSYTGTGADLNVDCGFSAGARFILIKRTDSTGDWYVWDSARGILAGNDPYLLLNSAAAEVTSTDYIDPLSSGFTVTSSASSTVNVSSGEYIFLAIA
jgi:hypothetical protein